MNGKNLFFGARGPAAVLLLLAAVFVISCGDRGEKREVDGGKLEQYFRSRYGAYMPAGFAVKASEDGDSAIKGFAKGRYDVTFSGGGSRVFPFYVSDDGRFLIMGGSVPVDVDEMEDTGVHGMKKGTLVVDGRSFPILVSGDRGKILVGEVDDISRDWAESIRSRISLENVPSKGSPEAKVNVIEYSDFQCGYCARVAPDVSALLSDYEGRIRVFYKQFPLSSIHPWAEAAAVASLCVYDQGNEKFWEFHDAVFERQKEIDMPDFAGSLSDIALGIGADMEKYDGCVASGEAKRRVASDLEEGQSIGVRATPTFVVDGVLIPGADIKAIRKAIDYRLSSRSGGR